jgi:hypothetical protein
VADAAGGASRVWVVTYPSPIAQDPNAAPDASRCSGLLNSTSDWLAGKVTELTSVITSAAASTGVHVIDISGVFHGHEACSGSSYVTEPDWLRAPWLSVSQLDNWLHPNQQGYQAMEAAVAAKIVIN